MEFLLASVTSGLFLCLVDENNPLLESEPKAYIPPWASCQSKSRVVYQPSPVERKTMNDKFLSPCPYCGRCMTEVNVTREHLVPRSMGGRCVIFVCRSCNNERGNSLTSPAFLNYIEKHPFIFLEHVRKSKCSPEMKDKLRSKIDPHVVHEYDLKKLSCSVMSKKSPKRIVRVQRSVELRRQAEARALARSGTPIIGGRAHRAQHQTECRMENRRVRHSVKVHLRKICEEYNYMNTLDQLFF